jgi:hypothetical protein
MSSGILVSNPVRRLVGHSQGGGFAARLVKLSTGPSFDTIGCSSAAGGFVAGDPAFAHVRIAYAHGSFDPIVTPQEVITEYDEHLAIGGMALRTEFVGGGHAFNRNAAPGFQSFFASPTDATAWANSSWREFASTGMGQMLSDAPSDASAILGGASDTGQGKRLPGCARPGALECGAPRVEDAPGGI